MATTPQIIGWSSTDKVPGIGGETVYGSGTVSASSVPITVLLVGTKGTSGSMTPNQDVLPVLSPDDADTKLQAGYELTLMAYGALLVPGVQVYVAPVAEAGGAASATLTITFAGTISAAGTWAFRLNGKRYSGSYSISDTLTTIAAAAVAAINGDSRCAFTAANTVGVVTVTVKSKGARGNLYIGVTDPLTALSSGLTMTITGGTALTGGAIPFTGGTGTETNTTLLGVINPTEYNRIGCAESDATNLAAWRTQLDAQAGPTSNLLQHLIFGTNGTLTAAQSLSQTTLNHPRFENLWYLNSEVHPAIAAGFFAALRAATEQTDPNASYDDVIMTPLAPQAFKQDWPSHNTLIAALNAGVTPIYTTTDGYAKICRAIQTRCLNGVTPDYRVLDTGDAYVPDFIRRDVGLDWSTSFRPANPRNAPDPADTSRPLPSGVATPNTWNTRIEAKMRKYERGEGIANGPIITDVDNNRPQSFWDADGKRIISVIPSKVMPNNHQVGLSVRQIAA